MNEIKDGGPAFPSHGSMGEVVQVGMPLRDYFAAKAMQGICAHVDSWGLDETGIARSAYSMADAMIRARGEA